MKKIAIAVMALGVLSLGSISTTYASVRTTKASITKNESGSNSGTLYNCTSKIGLKGSNSSTSSRGLYVEAYEDVKGPDCCERSWNMPVGHWKSYEGWKAESQGGDYYVHLDPAGPFRQGCIGSGTLFD